MDIGGFFEHFRTDRIIQTLTDWNLAELISDPWFLLGAAVLGLIAWMMRWYTALATLVGAIGAAWLISYTLARGTALEDGTNEALLLFVGGGLVVVGIIIYLVLLRSD